MELRGKKIGFDLEEFVPLLLSDEREAFRLIAEKFLNRVMESYLKGVSTRKVEAVVSELGIEISHTTVSTLSYELDELITGYVPKPVCRCFDLPFLSLSKGLEYLKAYCYRRQP